MTPNNSAPNSPVKGSSPAGLSVSSKIQPCHPDRLAVVYVRQSTIQQVAENRESTDRQYALVNRAIELGWSPDRILVIDEDQGKSGASADDRHGFQRLLAEVSLDHVGLILGLEMSRLARSCKDWHQLLELCSLFRTILADQDGLYDPTDHNDRLLLGLTGIMSEAELHLLRGRMRQGLLNKVRRGEVFLDPPVGYVRSPNGGFDLEPDEQARAVVRLVFDQFERLGTIRKVLRHLLANDIRVGIRPHAGPDRGQLQWRLPTRDTVSKMITHPIYAGYYCYGRKQTDPRRKKSGRRWSGRVVVPQEKYLALIPDRCPAYTTREQYEANQRRLAENRARTESKGAPREGPSLLAGLVVCGRCGKRMGVHYSGRTRILRYMCRTGVADARGTCRHSLSGRVLDVFVTNQVLNALRPGALELSLAAAEDVIRERSALDENWRQRLERARTQAARIERQYQTADPENRLVARTLERRWEETLLEVRRLEEEYARFRRTQPTALTPQEVDQVRELGWDLPALWDAPTTTPTDRQRIIRFLVERVEAAVEGTTDQVRVIITWAGGPRTSHTITRPVLRYEQTSDFTRLMARIRELRAEGRTFAAIAERLNAEGFHPPKGAARFHKDIVSLIVRQRTPGYQPPPKSDRSALGPNEWFVVDLAREVGIPKNTLHAWRQRGWVSYRRPPGLRTPCVCWADPEELDRLRRLARTPKGWWEPAPPPRLTTPKVPPRQYRRT
jgi:DNA invertase Pin-like site-specific DNA recombinase/DNA-binding transcriptional MerR regulator